MLAVLSLGAWERGIVGSGRLARPGRPSGHRRAGQKIPANLPRRYHGAKGEGQVQMWIPGSYVAPLREVVGGVRAATHLAQVRIGTGVVTAYVKAFTAGHERWLFNETAGSLLARQAGIGAPPGGLLWVPAAVLEQMFSTHRFAQHQGLVACYACAPVSDGYGLAAVGLAKASAGLRDQVAKLLLDWPGFAGCVAFDQWVGNVDRHADNLLLAGGGRVVPIDHGDCCGGPDQQDDDFIRPHVWFRNRALEDLFQPDMLPLPVKTGLAHAGERMVECHQHCRADIEALRPWLGEPLGLHWAEWLKVRSGLTAPLLRDRLRILV